MNTILNTLWTYLVAFNQARAAASLARCGLHQEAKALMLAK